MYVYTLVPLKITFEPTDCHRLSMTIIPVFHPMFILLKFHTISNIKAVGMLTHSLPKSTLVDLIIHA